MVVSFTDRRIEWLTERRGAEFVARAVASAAPGEGYLWEPRLLPPALLIRRELTFQCDNL
jgi:hypothetical protein